MPEITNIEMTDQADTKAVLGDVTDMVETGGTALQGTDDNDDGKVYGSVIDDPPVPPLPAEQDTDATTYRGLAGQRAEAEPGFSEYEKTADSADVEAGEEFATPETTVAGQLESILAKDSPLQRLAATRAKEQASALGMMSSSSGVGAGQRALYESAMPIAQQDAKTMAAFKAKEQEAVNMKRQIDQEAQVSGDLTLQKAKLQEEQKKINNGFAIAVKGLDADTEAAMMDSKGEWDKRIQDNQAALEKSLQESKLKGETEVLLMNQASESINQVQISMQQLFASEFFLDTMAAADTENGLDAGTTLQDYMNKLIETATGTIRFNAEAAGLYNREFEIHLVNLIRYIDWGDKYGK